MNRRHFVKTSTLAAAGILFSGNSIAKARNNNFPGVRIPAAKRKFKSKAVERVIAEVKEHIGNKELGWMFQNCFPNTLDTTVHFELVNGKPDTYVITGDIDAMWLRDSSAQVWPYLPLCKEDADLQQLIKGVINRQVKCILKDPYANAFYKDEHKISEWHKDLTDMKPGIHERKWEIDSLCYPIRLSHGYWKATGDLSVFDEHWVKAMELIVKTFREQQRWENKGPYHFQRITAFASDTVPLNGYGYPVKPNGLICSMFRPSDDATIYPYLIPSNFFAVSSLKHAKEILLKVNSNFDISEINLLIRQVSDALAECSGVYTERFGPIYAYEVNGMGSYNLMDDANVPSLLSLPYLIPTMCDDEAYLHTRDFVLSDDNPFFYKGKAGEGIGGPHVGVDHIWPLSIIMRALTSNNDEEISKCLYMLQHTHAGTGFMHESYQKDDATKFSRPWFAWANTLFGELIWKVYKERPHLLNA
ncbi:MAG: glycoside hydrolase family 125 protein [Bacteroidota bacterium]